MWFDLLPDGGKAYADKLEADGASVRYRNYDDIVHDFLTPRGVDLAQEAVEEVGGGYGSGILVNLINT